MSACVRTDLLDPLIAVYAQSALSKFPVGAIGEEVSKTRCARDLGSRDGVLKVVEDCHTRKVVHISGSELDVAESFEG